MIGCLMLPQLLGRIEVEVGDTVEANVMSLGVAQVSQQGGLVSKSKVTASALVDC